MSSKKKLSSRLSTEITRRDFLGGVLIGAGAALLSAPAPLFAAKARPKEVFSDPWTGFGGVGDYARSNGNTAAVSQAAHLIRDGHAPALAETAEDTGEIFDLIVIGGGFAGHAAAFQFHKKHGVDGRCLILDNHPIFGGEAKQNEFDVDGYRLYGPQCSNGFGLPTGRDGLSDEIWKVTGMPTGFEFAEPAFGSSKVDAPLDSFETMYWAERRFDTGYFFKDSGWVKNPWRDELRNTPWPDGFRKDMIRAFEQRKKYYQGDDFDRWLDSMSYKDLLEKEMGLDPGVAEFIDPILAISSYGLSSDVISAYAAYLLALPGTTAYGSFDLLDPSREVSFSFPGGNAGYLRHIVRYLIPDAIEGGESSEDTLNNAVNFTALDRPENPVSERLEATVIDVRHEGPVDSADYVRVAYYQDGKVRSLRAKAAVLSIGGWVARNIVSDLPVEIAAAYDEFHHGPVLVVNVALRNWKFLDRLGISSARWFEGFGTFCSIRRPMITGDSQQPFDPAKPTVMTFYVPFNYPGHGIKEQGVLARNELLSKSYAEYETEIRQQMTRMFGSAGFDEQRDIAGIVLNRWGHAFIAPQPGFYFGKDGQPAPKDVVRKGFGRIQFGHSELGARMNYRNAITEGGRAADQVMAKF
ncbi:MAG: NAD(P)-binding protein [Gammaproteobacteria bacterium]|nr:NAD(P)-binding protein [Gammaproteobacteria bacterium]